MTLLNVSGISKKDERGFELKNISFIQEKFHKIAVAGETGSGKSTLLKIVAGLIQPDTGLVSFEGKKVLGPNDKLVPGHPGIAYLSQHFELPINLRVEQVLEYANLLTDEAANTLYEVCQISHLLKRRTNQLSGGEKQRIAIARLLTTSPRLFLLDEPFSNTDMVHKNMLKIIIRDMGKKLKISCIIISHDPLDTLSWADEIIVMKDGAIVQQGTPAHIYRQPVDEYVAGLFGQYNLVQTPLAKELLKDIAIPSRKKLFVRPEDIRLSTNPGEGIEAIVKNCLFFGSYYDVEVQAGKHSLTARTIAPTFKEGDKVFISYTAGEPWHIG